MDSGREKQLGNTFILLMLAACKEQGFYYFIMYVKY